MLKYCLIIFVLGITASAYGQALVKGNVFENKTRIALADIQVQNINNKELTITDDKGKYTIHAKVGDILIFSGFAYTTDTLLVADLHQKEVSLILKKNILNDVNINSAAGAPGTFKFYDPQFHGQTLVYQRDNNGNYKGGVAFRLWYWKKDEKKKARQQKLIKDDNMREEIAKVFSRTTIGQYVPLRGDDLNDFISLYVPAIDIYANNDFNLASYLNDCYKKFIKLPTDKRHLEKLNN